MFSLIIMHFPAVLDMLSHFWDHLCLEQTDISQFISKVKGKINFNTQAFDL